VSATAPSPATIGDLWYNTTTGELLMWDGSAWIGVGGEGGGGATVSPTPPSSPITGDLWFNNTTDVLSIWDGSAWVAVGGGIGEAPEDGTLYGREDGAWVAVPPATTVGPAPPSPPQLGELWWNGASLNVWNGTQWVNVTGSYLSLSGGTLTGPLTLSGNATQPLQPVTLQQLTAGLATAGNVPISDTPPASPNDGQLWFDSVTNQLLLWNATTGSWQEASAPPVSLTSNPPAAPIQGDLWWDLVSAKLFIWDGEQWVIVVNTPDGGGTASDYRIKKDVVELPSMWGRVKELRPIKYTHADYTSPRSTATMVKADDIERWGFIAHELQETLVASAATGKKDQPDIIQSPNPFTLIAALTRALQEAMQRIEALEKAA
jgi:hypothetical protein